MRKAMDCREYPSEINCSLRISGEEPEVLKAAVEHAVSTHGEHDSPELRENIRRLLKDENEVPTLQGTRVGMPQSASL